jgi:3-oxoacyl-[acyl-carrier protein] reductase
VTAGARFEGKVAIVTGAASGIGRAIALRLGREGAFVAVNFLEEVRPAEAVASEIERLGGRALVVKADVADSSQVRAMFATTVDKFGRLDIVVNNAAWAFTKPIADVREDEFDRIFAVNVKGVFIGCQEAARRIADGGRIINLSSATTGLTLPGYGVYDATKGAVEQLARFLAHELGSRGVTVNTVSPGATETEQFRAGKSDELIHRLADMSAIKRLGRVEDIADVVAFLASEEARWVTGQNIRVNGGTV